MNQNIVIKLNAIPNFCDIQLTINLLRGPLDKKPCYNWRTWMNLSGKITGGHVPGDELV